MRKKMLLIAIMIFILSGCVANPTSKDVSFIVEDALGREVELSESPQKIVIAGKQTPMLANFAYIFNEKSEKIIAIENRSQSTDQFLKLLDNSIEEKLILEKGAGAEQIANLEPDLVILKTVMKEQIGDQLESIGIPVVYVSFESIDEIYRDLSIMGTLFDEKQKATKIIEYYESKKSEIDDLTKNVNLETDILFLQVKESDSGVSYSVPAGSWLQTQMVKELKGNPVWVSGDTGGGWADVNIEQIINWNPEKIMLINYQGKAQNVISLLGSDPVWEDLLDDSDVEIFPFPYDYLSWDQPDPRWILGYASIAHRLYVDRVTSDYLFETITDFYSLIFGFDDAMIRNEIIEKIETQFE